MSTNNKAKTTKQPRRTNMYDFGITLAFPNDVSEDIQKELISAEIDLDDYDYIIIAPAEAIQKSDDNIYRPTDYDLERMLHGGCDNRWYLVQFRGKMVSIGVAYHA